MILHSDELVTELLNNVLSLKDDTKFALDLQRPIARSGWRRSLGLEKTTEQRADKWEKELHSPSKQLLQPLLGKLSQLSSSVGKKVKGMKARVHGRIDPVEHAVITSATQIK